MKDKIQCCKKVYDGRSFRGYQCNNTGTLEHDGKNYCKTHHPPTVAEKDRARSAIYDAKWKANRDAENAKQELIRKGGLFDSVIAELKVFAKCTESLESHEEIQSIIDRYEEVKQTAGNGIIGE